jgi:hypothetical protein
MLTKLTPLRLWMRLLRRSLRPARSAASPSVVRRKLTPIEKIVADADLASE